MISDQVGSIVIYNIIQVYNIDISRLMILRILITMIMNDSWDMKKISALIG